MKKIFPVFFLFLLLLIPCLRAEEFRVEGMVEDSANPSQSVAVINGNSYKVGDKLGDSWIIAMGPASVKLRDASGKESELFVKEAPPAVKPKVSPLTAPSPESLLDKVGRLLTHPGQALDRVGELLALKALATINNASVRYYEKNKFFPLRLQQLIQEGFLPASYESGKIGKYQFYLSNKAQQPADLQLHGDPIVPGSGLRYFFIGPDAVIRFSFEKPADGTSPMLPYFNHSTASQNP